MTSKPRVVILAGPSGVGKSTWRREHLPDAVVCSADRWFTDADGAYRFDPGKLGEAHAACMRSFVDVLTISDVFVFPAFTTASPVVVDNTNTTIAEIAPYVAVARAYGVEPEIVAFRVGVVPGGIERLAARNVHGVPVAVILRQWGNLDRLLHGVDWPPFWPEPTIIDVEV